MQNIDKTLVERGKRYGEFNKHAEITQHLKQVMHDAESWNSLREDMKEALEMIVHKIGRILNGDPYYDDSWVDIAGYAKLVANDLTKPFISNELEGLADKVEDKFTHGEVKFKYDPKWLEIYNAEGLGKTIQRFEVLIDNEYHWVDYSGELWPDECYRVKPLLPDVIEDINKANRNLDELLEEPPGAVANFIKRMEG